MKYQKMTFKELEKGAYFRISGDRSETLFRKIDNTTDKNTLVTYCCHLITLSPDRKCINLGIPKYTKRERYLKRL
jgi:hypothetical protein